MAANAVLKRNDDKNAPQICRIEMILKNIMCTADRETLCA